MNEHGFETDFHFYHKYAYFLDRGENVFNYQSFRLHCSTRPSQRGRQIGQLLWATGSKGPRNIAMLLNQGCTDTTFLKTGRSTRHVLCFRYFPIPNTDISTCYSSIFIINNSTKLIFSCFLTVTKLYCSLL